MNYLPEEQLHRPIIPRHLLIKEIAKRRALESGVSGIILPDGTFYLIIRQNNNHIEYGDINFFPKSEILNILFTLNPRYPFSYLSESPESLTDIENIVEKSEYSSLSHMADVLKEKGFDISSMGPDEIYFYYIWLPLSKNLIIKALKDLLEERGLLFYI